MVIILCEGKTDKKFINGLLSHLGIEERGGDFEIMGCKR
jgi:5S rRNA maturation endonuclease (ribonuclease M5)